MTRRFPEWLLPLVAAVLSFAGAVLGALVAGHLQLGLWQQQANFERGKILFEQRVRLIERVAKAESSVPRFAIYADYASRMACQDAHVSRCAIHSAGSSNSKTPEIESSLEVTSKLTDMNAEVAATLGLVRIHFGPPIKSVVDRLTREKYWWAETSKPLWSELLTSMTAEVQHP